MKIGIDARHYRANTGGIGRYTRGLIRHLLEIDQENDYLLFLTPEDAKEYTLSARNARAEVVAVPPCSFQEQTHFYRLLKKHACEVVHFTNFNHPLLYQGNFVVTIHDLIPLIMNVVKKHCTPLKNGIRYWLFRHATRAAKKIISISDATKQDLLTHLGTDSDKITTIYLGIDNAFSRDLAPQPERLRQKYGITSPYILFLSQWSPNKGLGELLSAFEQLRREGCSHQLVLAGKPVPRFPEYTARIARSPYKKEIVVTGFVEDKDVPLLYKQADLFVFPSHREGFGIPPLEAMAVGTPVVASHTSCMPEILGEAATYVNPTLPAELAQGIRRVLTSPSLQETLRQRGFAQVKKYSWRTMAEETLALYRASVLN